MIESQEQNTNEEKLKHLKEKLDRRAEMAGPVAAMEERNAFAIELKEKYSVEEVSNSRLYHLILGSDPDPELGMVTSTFDLPGGEIEEFIEGL